MLEIVPARARRRPAPLVVLALTGAALLAAPALASAQTQPYRTVVPASAQSDAGLFTVHRVGETLLFEIPDSILGRDMAVMSRYARAQQDLADGGDRMAPNMVVRWERRGERIDLRAISHESTADPNSSLHLAVENSNFAPVLASLPLRARGEGSSVMDVTDLYLGETPAFTLPRQARTRHTVRSYDRGRSWLEWARSFPINVEVRVVQTYAAEQPPSNARGGTISFEVNHSMILLPAEPMMPRLYDERVGYISTGQTDYSRDFQGVRPQRYIRRYRLEPSDTAAWLRGELCRAREPLGLVHRPGDAGVADPLLHGGGAGVERGVRARRVPERAAGPRRANGGGGPGVQPSGRAVLGDPVRGDPGPLRELGGRCGGPAVRGGDPRTHQPVPRPGRAAALVAGLAGRHGEPELPDQPPLARGHGRGAALRRLARDRALGGAAAQPACELRVPDRLDPQPGLRGAGRALRVIGRTHALQLRRAARRRRRAGAEDGAVGSVRGDVGVPSDPRGPDARRRSSPR
jgi:hypothetical protein